MMSERPEPVLQRNLSHIVQQLDEPPRLMLGDGRALFGRRRRSVADHAVRVEVAGDPGKGMRAGRAEVAELLPRSSRRARRNSAPCSCRRGRAGNAASAMSRRRRHGCRAGARASENMPSGWPKRVQLVFTASMLARTRSSRATMPMISSLPPCELTKTSLRTPARRDRQAELGPGLDQRRRPEASACPARRDARSTCRPPGPAGCGRRGRRAASRSPSSACPSRSARRCRPADAARAARPPRAAGWRSSRPGRSRRIRSSGSRPSAAAVSVLPSRIAPHAGPPRSPRPRP